VVAGATSAKLQLNSAAAQKIELDSQADDEELAGEARELSRREQLNKVLSSNIASLAASGISGEGTPASIALANAKTASASEGLEGLASRLKQAQLKRQGKNASKTGNLAAASTLLNTAVKSQQLS
jgi:hypothetical protein